MKNESTSSSSSHRQFSAVLGLSLAVSLLSACADTNMSGPAGAGTTSAAQAGGPNTASDTTGSTAGQSSGMNSPQH